MLSRVVELIIEVAVFLREHGSVKLATLFDDDRFQLKVLHLADIFSLLNELNYSLQEKNLQRRFPPSSYFYGIYSYGEIISMEVIPMEKESKKPNRRDGVVVRASASQSVDLGFIPLVESYQKTLKNGIRSFPAWRSAFRGGCGEQAGKFACCVLGQGT